MILRGLAEWTADPADCILIGDKESDIAAATAAGIKGYLFEGSNLLDFVRQDIMRNS
jgi:D-glycero-D-manno-heptose 1,7-bisphosphate phosphatase